MNADWGNGEIPPNRTSGRRADRPYEGPSPKAPRDPLAPRPKVYIVPAGRRATACNGPHCDAVVYWVVDSFSGRRVPVDCAVPGGLAPSVHTAAQRQLDLFGGAPVEHPHDGVGHSHLETCVDADYLRDRARQRRQR